MGNDAFAGRTALITGAGRGIGRELALLLAEAGVATVGLIARGRDGLEATAQLVDEAGAKAVVLAADLGDLDSLPGLLDTIHERVGDPDILLNNAATVEPLGASQTLETAAVENAYRLNVIAPMALSAGLLPHMLSTGWGRVVNVSSGVAAHPENMVGGSTYAATKSALEAATLSLAAEHAGTGVTFDIYRPGTVDTAMQQWIRAQDADRIGAQMHERFNELHDKGNLISARHSAESLVRRLAGATGGQIWDVSDPRTE